VADERTKSGGSRRELEQLSLRVAELETLLAEARSAAGVVELSGRARADSAQLGRSQARAQAVLASMLDPMISIDDHGVIQAASDSVERVFGYTPRELLGRNINLLMHEPHRSSHDGYLQRYRKTGEAGIIGRTREFDVLCKDGRTIVCALSVSRADPGDGTAVFTGTFRDITELKRTAQALAESERRFRAVFDQAFHFIGLLEPDGRVLEVNRAALEFVHTTREDVVGRPFWDTPWWSHSAETRERIQQAVEAAAKGEFVRFETQHTSGAGNVHEVDFSLKPVKDEAGKVVLLLPEGHDVSDLKRAQRTETAMLRAFATIGESAALLAHEIKNPITAVNLALRAVADQLGEDQHAILDDLITRMQRIEQMMRRTLSFAKPIELRERECDAHVLFQATVSLLRPQIEQAGAVVETRSAPGAVRFHADPALLQDVLTNLVTNAIEAQPRDARVVLAVETSRGGSILLSVEDDGPGVPESLRDSLFKPFVSTKQKGNGLGLAICRKVVEEHGGTLDLAPRRAKGARFEIRLPAKKRIT
jgi:PAS domain S-box-containing protein